MSPPRQVAPELDAEVKSISEKSVFHFSITTPFLIGAASLLVTGAGTAAVFGVKVSGHTDAFAAQAAVNKEVKDRYEEQGKTLVHHEDGIENIKTSIGDLKTASVEQGDDLKELLIRNGGPRKKKAKPNVSRNDDP